MLLTRGTAFLPVILLLWGCASTSIYVPIKQPSAIPLDGYRIIIVGSFLASENDSVQVGEGFVEGHRTLLAASLKERFPQAHIVSDGQRISGDRIVTVFGVVLRARYLEDIAAASIYAPDAPSTKKERKGIVQLAIDYRLVEQGADTLRYQHMVETSVQTSQKSVDIDPPSINTGSLFDAASRQSIDAFLALTVERSERAVVVFLTDPGFPEIATGIQAAKRGDWHRAKEIFHSLAKAQDGKEDADRHWYNYGIASQYSHDFRSALTAFERAQQLRKNKRYELAIDRLMEMEKEYLQLKKEE